MKRYPQHILVIDGDDQYRKLVVEILSAKDYVVFSAHDKEMAEFILGNNAIDLIIENIGKSEHLVSEKLIEKSLHPSKAIPQIIAMSGSPIIAPLSGRIAGTHIKGLDPIEMLLQQVAKILFE